MKDLRTIRGAVLVNTLISLAIGGWNSQAIAQDGCTSTMASVSKDMQSRVGALISEVKEYSPSQFASLYFQENYTYNSPFNNADRIVIFYLASDMGRGTATQNQSRAGSNLVDSPQLTKDYSRQIIDACKRVASVKFHYWNWFTGYSLHSDGQLLKDNCIEARRSNPYWGELPCAGFQ